MAFREIKATEIDGNFIKIIGQDWMLITAQDENGRVNTMTAAWGSIGFAWRMPIAMCMVRRSRFTHRFIECADTFSLTFFDESYRGQLNLCGKESGRDIDKIAACGFSVLHEGETPYFEQARLVLICRKVAQKFFDADAFIDSDIIESAYPGPQRDFHDMYFGEIVKVLVKDVSQS